MGLDSKDPEARTERPPHLSWPPRESASETASPDIDLRDEAGPASIGTQTAESSTSVTRVLDHAYAPLLGRLEADCRHVLSVAEFEAETLRTRAQEEAQRIVADAHRERFMLLSRASEKQAQMYQEAEAEINRWLNELEDQRVAILGAARGEYDQMVRNHFAAAEQDARRIIEAAHAEAMRTRAAEAVESAPTKPVPAVPSPALTPDTSSMTQSVLHDDEDALFWDRDASTDSSAWINEPAVPTAAEERSDPSAPPAPERRARKHRRWFRIRNHA